MHYTYLVYVYTCDRCESKTEVADSGPLQVNFPDGWEKGSYFKGMRSMDYNNYIVNLHKDFCPACVKKLEIEETFA